MVRSLLTFPVGTAGRRLNSALPWKVLCALLLLVNVGLIWSFDRRCPSPLPVRAKGEPFDISGVVPPGVTYGSAKLDGASHRKWFLGHFIDQKSRRFSDISFKWSTNPRGATNGEVATNKVGHSISILIQGKMQVEFQGANLTLSRLGDYVLWEPGVPHSWTALENTITLSARWPSLPNDQTSAVSF